MPWYVWIISGLSMLYSMAVWQYRPPMQTAPPTPVTAPEPLPVALYVPPALATPPANIEAEKLADVVWGMDSTGRRRGEFTPDDAYVLAEAVLRCDHMDPHRMIALAWVESGFRTSAISPSGKHYGLWQVANAKFPHSIPYSAGEACGKLEWWREWCHKNHDHPTEWLQHWFAGVRGNDRARASMRKVHERRARLLSSTKSIE